MVVPLNRPRHLPFKFNSKINYKFKDLLYVWPFHISLIALPSKVLNTFSTHPVFPYLAFTQFDYQRQANCQHPAACSGGHSISLCPRYLLSWVLQWLFSVCATRCTLRGLCNTVPFGTSLRFYPDSIILPISHNHTSFKYGCYTIIAIGSVFK